MANRYGPSSGQGAENWAKSLRKPSNEANMSGISEVGSDMNMTSNSNRSPSFTSSPLKLRSKGKIRSLGTGASMESMIDNLITSQHFSKPNQNGKTQRSQNCSFDSHVNSNSSGHLDESTLAPRRKYNGHHFALRIIEDMRNKTKDIQSQNENEETSGVIHLKNASNTVIYHQLSFSDCDASGERKGETEIFRFNPGVAYGFDTNDSDVFINSIQPAVLSAVQGENVTVCLLPQNKSEMEFTKCEGTMISFAAKAIFNALNLVLLAKQQPHVDVDGTVCISWISLYKEEFFDVLKDSANVPLRSGTPKTNQTLMGHTSLTDMVEVKLESSDDANQLIKRVGELYGRENSNNAALPKWVKGHSIVTLRVNHNETVKGSKNSSTSTQGKVRFLTFDPSAENMKSLSSVLEALEMKKPMVPFHKSKITMLMKDAFYGNEKLVVLGTICCKKHELSQEDISDTRGDVSSPKKRDELVGIISKVQADSVVSTFGLVAHIQQVCQGDCFEAQDTSTISSQSLSQRSDNNCISPFSSSENKKVNNESFCDQYLNEYLSANVDIENVRSIAALVSEMSDENNDTSKWLSAIVKSFEKSQQELENQMEKYEYLEEKNKELRKENQFLKKESEETKESLKQAKSNISFLVGHNEARQRVEMRYPDESTESDIIGENAENKKSSKIHELQQKLRKAYAEIKDYEMYKDVMETAMVRLKDEMTRLSKENSKYKQELPKLRQRAKKDNSAARISSRKLEDMQVKMVQSLEEEQDAKRKLLKEREQNQKVQRESIVKIKSLNGEIAELRKQNEEFEESKRNDALKIIKDQERIHILETELADALALIREITLKYETGQKEGENKEYEEVDRDPSFHADTALLEGKQSDPNDKAIRNRFSGQGKTRPETLVNELSTNGKAKLKFNPKSENFTANLVKGLKERRQSKLNKPVTSKRHERIAQALSEENGSISKDRDDLLVASSKVSTSKNQNGSNGSGYKSKRRPEWGAGPGHRRLSQNI